MHFSGSRSLLFTKNLKKFQKKSSISFHILWFTRYKSGNIFVSVATKMSRLDPDPARFVTNRLPGSGSSNCYYAKLDKSRRCKLLNTCSKRKTHLVVFYKEHNSTTPFILQPNCTKNQHFFILPLFVLQILDFFLSRCCRISDRTKERERKKELLNLFCSFFCCFKIKNY